MKEPPAAATQMKPIPTWARIILALGGVFLCGLALAALFIGASSDWKNALRAAVGLGLGLVFLVGALVRRWPGTWLTWLLP
jgi:hypothetical protein